MTDGREKWNALTAEERAEQAPAREGVEGTTDARLLQLQTQTVEVNELCSGDASYPLTLEQASIASSRFQSDLFSSVWFSLRVAGTWMSQSSPLFSVSLSD